MVFLPISLIAGFFDLCFLAIILAVARRRGWYDPVEPRKLHTGQIPRLGGVGIFWSFSLAFLLSFLLVPDWGLSRLPGYATVAIGGALLGIHLIGLIDDFRELRARIKFIAELLLALLVVSVGYRFELLTLPFSGRTLELGWISYPFTLLWLVGVTNAINMIDGMDGLSGGLAVIASFSLAVLAIGRGGELAAALALILVGSLVGYLFFNLPPARIFMGDSGSGFLGFLLALLPLLDQESASRGLWLWDAATILLVPIYDVFAAIIRRRRAGLPVMAADRSHLHHKLLDLGLDCRSVLVLLYGPGMILGIVAGTSLFLPPTTYLGLVLVVWLVYLAVFIGVSRARSRSGISSDAHQG